MQPGHTQTGAPKLNSMIMLPKCLQSAVDGCCVEDVAAEVAMLTLRPDQAGVRACGSDGCGAAVRVGGTQINGHEPSGMVASSLEWPSMNGSARLRIELSSAACRPYLSARP